MSHTMQFHIVSFDNILYGDILVSDWFISYIIDQILSLLLVITNMYAACSFSCKYCQKIIIKLIVF